MIVVDSNVLAYLYFPTSFTEHAEALLQQEPDWVAPLLWRSEFRNILTGHLRRGTIHYDMPCELQAAAEELLESREFDTDSADGLALVRDSNCSAYEFEFVAVARVLGAPLVTMDRKVLEAFPDHAEGSPRSDPSVWAVTARGPADVEIVDYQ